MLCSWLLQTDGFEQSLLQARSMLSVEQAVTACYSFRKISLKVSAGQKKALYASQPVCLPTICTWTRESSSLQLTLHRCAPMCQFCTEGHVQYHGKDEHS